MAISKKSLTIGAVLIALACAGISYDVAVDDTHCWGYRYWVWSKGRRPEDWKHNLVLLNQDMDLWNKLSKGKSVPELTRWFPELVPPSRGTKDQLDAFKGTCPDLKDSEFLFFGKSMIGVELKHGSTAGILRFDKG